MLRLSRFFLKNLFSYLLNLWVIGSMTSLVVMLILEKLGLNYAWNPDNFRDIGINYIPLLPVLALLEEIVFRFIPFLAIHITTYQFSSRQIFLIMLAVSASFGLAHGSVGTMFVQGSIGLYLAWIFWIYSFRLKNVRGLFIGLAASTVVHFTFNTAVLLIATLPKMIFTT